VLDNYLLRGFEIDLFLYSLCSGVTPRHASTIEVFAKMSGLLLAPHRFKNCIARAHFYFYFGPFHFLLNSGDLPDLYFQRCGN
jgi:hypothetical protein